MRIAHWKSALLAAAALALAVSGCTSGPKPDLRAEYQAALDANPARFDANSLIIGAGGRLYVQEGALENHSCVKLCGVLVAKDPADPQSGFKVSLPIGFRVALNTPGETAGSLVTELTYWDPILHKKMSTPYTHNQSAEIPEGLVAYTLDTLPANTDAYIQGAYVYRTPQGDLVVDRNAPVWREPIGLQYGMTVTVKVSGNADALAVCAPPDTVLSSTIQENGIRVASFSQSC